MNYLTIRITKSELEKSKFCGLQINGHLHETCAIQMALKEIFPEAIVLQERLYVDLDAMKTDHFISLPKCAMQFIQEFDRASPHERIKMQELEFKIEIDEPHYISFGKSVEVEMI